MARILLRYHFVLLGVRGSIPGIGPRGNSEGGVIDIGDEGDIGFGDSVVAVGDAVIVVAAVEGVFGTPHARDSVPFMCVSLGSHIGFCPGVTLA